MLKKLITIALIVLFCHSFIFVLQAKAQEQQPASNNDSMAIMQNSSDMMQVVAERMFPNYRFSIGLRAGYFSPFFKLGEKIDSYFAGSLFFRYNPGLLDGLVFEFETSFIPATLKDREDSYVHTLGAAAGARYEYPLISVVTVGAFANFGVMDSFFYGSAINDSESILAFLFRGGIEFGFELAYHSDISLGFSYHTSFYYKDLQGLSIYTAYNFRIGGEPKENQLKISNPNVNSVFPVLKDLYTSKYQVGSVTIKNSGDDGIESIQVALFVENYMDIPTVSPVSYELTKDESLIVPLYAIFNNQILTNDNDNIESAEIIIRYSIGGTTYTKRENASIVVYSKNALVWEPVERICSFVSPQDPVIQELRSSVESRFFPTDDSFLSTNIRKAIKAFQLLKSIELNYLSDPSKPFAISEGGAAQAIDTVLFPSDFLIDERRTGDCDDVSVLYTSLLESLGVPAGFIVTSQHIFAMFNTGVNESQISQVTENQGKILVIDGQVWMPVETTFLDKDYGNFLEAWDMAAQEYRSNQNSLTLVQVQSSWQDYPPAVNGTQYPEFSRPDYNSANDNYNQIVSTYKNQNLGGIEDAIQRSIYITNNANNLTPEEKNQARYDGLFLLNANQHDYAINIFSAIAGDNDRDFEDYFYLGIAYVRKGNSFNDALSAFLNAEQTASSQQVSRDYLAKLYLAISISYDRLGNTQQRQIYYQKLNEISPTLGYRYQYLGGN